MNGNPLWQSLYSSDFIVTSTSSYSYYWPTESSTVSYSDPSSGSGGLSGGVIAGIVFGVIGAFMVALGLISCGRASARASANAQATRGLQPRHQVPPRQRDMATVDNADVARHDANESAEAPPAYEPSPAYEAIDPGTSRA